MRFWLQKQRVMIESHPDMRKIQCRIHDLSGISYNISKAQVI